MDELFEFLKSENASNNTLAGYFTKVLLTFYEKRQT